MAKRQALGKGLGGLIQSKTNIIPQNPLAESAVKGAAVMVDIRKLDRNKEQPRKKFKEEPLAELSASIKEHGILQPIVVQDKKDHYEIIAGERRWRAAIQAGLTEVPVIIKNLTDQEIFEISLIENLQREDLDPIEEAAGYKRLKEDFSLTDEQVAEKVFKSRTEVTNSMRLLKLSKAVQQYVMEDKLSKGHARALLGIEDATRQAQVAKQVIEQALNVRETEKLVRDLNAPKKPEVKKEDNIKQYRIQYESLAKRLSESLGAKVKVTLKDKNKGKIELDFYSSEEFNKIYEKLLK
ncbi:MAG: ParB/RepB/Spo0J family partition protein [Lachnospiraceae bacterium]|nr:ParB/RepB/Spo0J family partition protein [Lachnospiraceae bacterium]